MNKLKLSWLSLCFLTTFSFADIAITPDATVKDSPTTLLGVNHIGLTVTDLDAALAFYQVATGFEVIRRETVRNNPRVDQLYNHPNIEYEIAVLEAPNLLFELTEFTHNKNKQPTKMPVQGPGMTHTCFQSAMTDPGYDRFIAVGADPLSRGEEAVDIGGYGVTYAYAYDPDGNMLELEQLDIGPLSEVPKKLKWQAQGHSTWMTQVALATHDLERLTDYYEKILAFPPYRYGDYVDNPKLDDVADYEGLSLRASWFRMNDREISLEFWEYRKPITEQATAKRGLTDFGYSFSMEVSDIQAEYKRMKALGVEFIGEPVEFGDFWQVFANDIDGNVFALRQAIDPNSPYSVPQLEL